MSRFSDEIRIIPGIAWVLAVVAWLCMFMWLFFVAVPHGQHSRFWPPAGQLAFALWPGLLLGIWALLIGYINADARRRGMRHIMWTLLAMFVPNTIGIILYFVFREPLLARCPKCGAQGRANFAFCPQCGTQMTPACPSCKRPVEAGWQRCPYCGAGLGAAPAVPATVNQPANRNPT